MSGKCPVCGRELEMRKLKSGELLTPRHKAWQVDPPFRRFIKCPGSGRRIKDRSEG